MNGKTLALLVRASLLGLTAFGAAVAQPPSPKPTKPARTKAAKPKAPTMQASIARGRTLFLANCATCHGVNAGGDDGPSLRQKHLANAFVTTAVQKGFQGEMPPFGSKLKSDEIKALVAYIHSLQ